MGAGGGATARSGPWGSQLGLPVSSAAFWGEGQPSAREVEAPWPPPCPWLLSLASVPSAETQKLPVGPLGPRKWGGGSLKPAAAGWARAEGCGANRRGKGTRSQQSVLKAGEGPQAAEMTRRMTRTLPRGGEGGASPPCRIPHGPGVGRRGRRARGRGSPRSFPAPGPSSLQNRDKDLTPRGTFPVWPPDLCSPETTSRPRPCLSPRPQAVTPPRLPRDQLHTLMTPALGPPDPRGPPPRKDAPGQPQTFLLKPA